MNSKKKNINANNGSSWHDAWKGDNILFSDDDIALFEMTGSYTRALSDLEEVRDDTSLAGARKDAGKMVSDFKSRAERLEANEKFVSDVLSGSDENRNILEEIKKIKLEINEKQINELTADWVKEWHENRQQGAVKEEKKREIRNFITSSLEKDEPLPEINLTGVKEEAAIETKEKDRKTVRRIPLRWISYSAAAVLALLFVIKSLLPSTGPEKLYSQYYKPFEIVSPVTRNATEGKNRLEDAVTMYKNGDYRGAAASFADVIAYDKTLVAPRFYYAMSEMASGENKQAVNILESIAGKGGEFSREAEWYLGLAYIKTGETAKARNCFESLSKSGGYYSDRAEKLLRRLK